MGSGTKTTFVFPVEWMAVMGVCVCGVEGVGGDSRALAAHSLDVTYCIGSVCGR